MKAGPYRCRRGPRVELGGGGGAEASVWQSGGFPLPWYEEYEVIPINFVWGGGR